MMAIFFCKKIEGLTELVVHKGDVYIPCYKIASNLVTSFCTQIPALLFATYILSGCYTESYPFGRGKKKGSKCDL